MDVIKEGENRPSEVFLALWYFRANREPLSAENFKLCAETWWRLRAAEAARAKEALDAILRRSGDPHPEDSGKPEPESGPDRTPAAADIAAISTDEIQGELDRRKAVEAAKAKSAAGASSFVTRKQNVLAALEELRARGVSLQTIADADRRLTINDVLQMMEHKPVSLPVLSALERAISTLQAKEGPPAEEDMS